jgi:hypothetical protein
MFQVVSVCFTAILGISILRYDWWCELVFQKKDNQLAQLL